MLNRQTLHMPSAKHRPYCWRSHLLNAGKIAITIATLTFPLAIQAQPPSPPPHSSGKGQPASGNISHKQAAQIAQQRYPGKVLSIKQQSGSYQVKILHQGQVRIVNIDSRR